MTIKKQKLNFIIVCDDIRQEVGNKASFIGIYSKYIFIPSVPFIFPKLCFAVRCSNFDQSSSFEATLIAPSGKQLGQIKGGSPKAEIQHGTVDLHAFFSPLKIDEEGEYKFVVQFSSKIQYKLLFTIKKPSQKMN